jgi:hypothetical protein
MARAAGEPDAETDSGSRPLSKNQRRMLAVLNSLPPAREQLLAAMEDISESFDLATLSAAAESDDPRERNKVSAIERQTETLVNWMDELAARALDEGLRIGSIEKASGTPWQRLVELEVITQASAERLRTVRDTRDDLGHAYPPQSWQALHVAVEVILDELDGYVAQVYDWALENHILPDLHS